MMSFDSTLRRSLWIGQLNKMEASLKTEQLITSLHSESSKKKTQALIKLATAKVKAKSAVPEIKLLLSDADAEVRLHALAAIEAIVGLDVGPCVRDCLKDPNPKVRAYSAMLISRLGEKHVGYPVLRAMLRSPDRSEYKAAKTYVDFVEEDFHPERIAEAERSPGPSLNSAPESSGSRTETISCPLSSQLEVTMIGCDETRRPSAPQARAFELIGQLPKSTTNAVRRELGRILREQGDGDDVDSEDPLDVSFLLAVIPPLTTSEDVYFFLGGDSDYDIEHGFACLFKNAQTFCVCDPDVMRRSCTNGAAAAFEAILASGNTVNLE